MARYNEEIEAANRAEAVSFLIRAGYRVYRPEADCDGEDLLIRQPKKALKSGILAIQLKSRLTVHKKYLRRKLWMLFPVKKDSPEKWILIPHAILYKWMKQKHGDAPSWGKRKGWSIQNPGEPDRKKLRQYVIRGS